MTRILALAMGTAVAAAGVAATASWSPVLAQSQPEAGAPARGGTELSPSERRRPQERQRDLVQAFDLDRDGVLNLAETKAPRRSATTTSTPTSTTPWTGRRPAAIRWRRPRSARPTPTATAW